MPQPKLEKNDELEQVTVTCSCGRVHVIRGAGENFDMETTEPETDSPPAPPEGEDDHAEPADTPPNQNKGGIFKRYFVKK